MTSPETTVQVRCGFQTLRWVLIGLLFLTIFGAGAAAQRAPLAVEQVIDPEEFVVLGTGSPDTATVTITLTAAAIQGPPLDLVLALDRSQSVELAEVQRIARAFVTHLSGEDRVAVVSFGDMARVELEFTDDKDRALAAIEDLASGGQTALGDGLMLAVDHAAEARSGAFPLVVIPTDGVGNVGRDPLPQAERAGEEEIPIFPVAVSTAARRRTLGEIASQSGGTFYARFSATDTVESVFRKAERSVAAREILVTQTLTYPLRFQRAIETSPSVLPGRTVTQLQWRLPLIFRGEAWRARFEVGALEEGTHRLGTRPSAVVYTDPYGERITEELPTLAVTVERGPKTPERPGEISPPEERDGANRAPRAQLAFSPGAPVWGEAIRFDASGSSDPDGEITKYEWDWTNDGTFDQRSEEPTALHPYGSAGEFTVRLRVTDDGGKTDEATATVTVAQGLKAGAAASEDFEGDPTVPDWMDYYIDDGVVTEEEARDANARFAADVFIPGTRYRLTADDVTAIVQINRLAQRVAKYKDVSAAEADGYVKVGPFIPEVGQAYVKEAFLTGPPVADRPPVLLFDLDAEGTPVLAGVRFIATSEEDATLFQVTDWPDHRASAHFKDGSEQAVSSAANAPQENSRGSPLAFWHPTLYGLSVWVGMPNPDGLFASRHPKVKE